MFLQEQERGAVGVQVCRDSAPQRTPVGLEPGLQTVLSSRGERGRPACFTRASGWERHSGAFKSRLCGPADESPAWGTCSAAGGSRGGKSAALAANLPLRGKLLWGWERCKHGAFQRAFALHRIASEGHVPSGELGVLKWGWVRTPGRLLGRWGGCLLTPPTHTHFPLFLIL